MKKHLHLRGLGDIYPYCCNFDLCNVDMCTSMGLQKGHSLCTTTIEHKLKELQHKPNLADVEIIAPIANSNSNKVNIRCGRVVRNFEREAKTRCNFQFR